MQILSNQKGGATNSCCCVAPPSRACAIYIIFCAYTGLAYSDAVTVTPDDIVERGGRRYIHSTQIYAKVLAQTVVDDGAELAGKIR